MSNANTPAAPYSDLRHTDFGPRGSIHVGLTKREYFAAAAMQGSISRGYWGESDKDKAKEAIRAADALLAELERTQ